MTILDVNSVWIDSLIHPLDRKSGMNMWMANLVFVARSTNKGT